VVCLIIGAVYTVPAHTNLVSCVKYFKPGRGFEYTHIDTEESSVKQDSSSMNEDTNMDIDDEKEDEHALTKLLLSNSTLISSSYDQTIKIWCDVSSYTTPKIHTANGMSVELEYTYAYRNIKTVDGLGKVMSCDFSPGMLLYLLIWSRWEVHCICRI
jgi:hypothetical protein